MCGVDPTTGAEAQVYLFPGKNASSLGELSYKKPLLYGETQDDIISINASTGVEHSLAPTTEGEGLFRGDGVVFGTTAATGSGAAGTIFAFGPKTPIGAAQRPGESRSPSD